MLKYGKADEKFYQCSGMVKFNQICHHRNTEIMSNTILMRCNEFCRFIQNIYCITEMNKHKK